MKSLFFVAAFLFLAVVSASASPVDVDKIIVKHSDVKRNGASLSINIDVEIGKGAVSNDYKLKLMPVFFKGSQEKLLPPIYVETRRSKIRDERVAMSTGKAVEYLPGTVLARNGMVVNYHYDIAYEPWMDGSDLRLYLVSSGCCKNDFFDPLLLAQNLSLEFIPLLEKQIERVPKVEQAVKRWEFSKEDMIIDFVVNRTEINPDLFENRQTLQEILSVISKLQSDPEAVLNKIEITGYASPEGSVALNQNLAEKRSKALELYLKQQNDGLSSTMFETVNGGVNWVGLRRYVAESDKPYKEKVLYIIDNVPAEIVNGTSLKKQLMDLDGGRPYRDMFKSYFDRLRTACYVGVYYDVMGDRAADVINGALALMAGKEYDKALTDLLTVETDSRSWNAIGVCYMMTNRYNDAKVYLQKAADSGSVSALGNLKLLGN